MVAGFFCWCFEAYFLSSLFQARRETSGALILLIMLLRSSNVTCLLFLGTAIQSS